jgi:hypothetical protein
MNRKVNASQIRNRAWSGRVLIGLKNMISTRPSSTAVATDAKDLVEDVVQGLAKEVKAYLEKQKRVEALRL